MDADFEAAPAQVQRAYLGMLGVDALLGFMGSVEKLTDWAVERGGEVPEAMGRSAGTGAGRGGGGGVGVGARRVGCLLLTALCFSPLVRMPLQLLPLPSTPHSPTMHAHAAAVDRIDAGVCKAMVERTWRGLLAAVTQLLQRSSGEEIVLQLLRVGGSVGGMGVGRASRRAHGVKAALVSLCTTVPLIDFSGLASHLTTPL